MVTSFQVTFDCADPKGLARFWAELLGYVIPPPPDGFGSWDDWLREHDIPEESWNDAGAVVDPGGAGPRLFFQRVPEGKVAKNRVHLDVNVGAGLSGDERRERVRQEAERAIGLGAVHVEDKAQRNEFWIVLRDPEGNELCLQ